MMPFVRLSLLSRPPNRSAAVFGMADGLTVVTGIITGMAVAHVPALPVWHAALSGGTAELVGMTAGQRQADPAGGWPAALCNGGSAFAACVLPALAYLLLPARAALPAAAAAVTACCAVIAMLREEKGIRAVLQTYGLTIAAAAATALANRI
jgi:VIT1/CCC1 family predicted Fe2+/Mn2+ transporter